MNQSSGPNGGDAVTGTHNGPANSGAGPLERVIRTGRRRWRRVPAAAARAERRQRARVEAVVERLDAELVPGAEQLARPAVPDGEGEHAAEPVHHVLADQGVGLQQHLGVAARPQHHALLPQLGSQLQVVVNLAVEDHPVALVGRPHRLMAALRQVDDGQPPEAQRDIVIGVEALIIRPAVGDPPGGGRHPGLIRVGVDSQRQAADNSAHGRPPPSVRKLLCSIVQWGLARRAGGVTGVRYGECPATHAKQQSHPADLDGDLRCRTSSSASIPEGSARQSPSHRSVSPSSRHLSRRAERLGVFSRKHCSRTVLEGPPILSAAGDVGRANECQHRCWRRVSRCRTDSVGRLTGPWPRCFGIPALRNRRLSSASAGR